MPKNTRGGNKTKKQRRNWGRFEPIDKLEKGQMFGKINENNGNHFVVLCSDNVKRQAPMSNSVKKGPRLYENTFVAVSLREFESNQENCDILGIARPPNNIIEIFKRIDPTRNHTNDVEFGDSDNEFEEIVEIKKNTVSANGICTTNYIDYPTIDSDEYEEDEDEENVDNIQNTQNTQNIEEEKEESNVQLNMNRNINKNVNTDKLSNSKKKLIANFMKDDSDDSENSDEEDLDKL